MSTYQVIAKKFRPQKFSEVFEQGPIVQTIKNAIRLKRLGHAYLFSGTKGTGKTTLARLFAKALNCQAPTPEGEPCNVCSSCLEIMGGNCLDVIEIDGASNRGIDDIRSLNETVGYAPSNGKYKIYLVDEVHMLTKEAFNALLKTLEEPPEHVVFFFATTEPHKVLPTILSRCQRFDLRRISLEKIGKKLTEIAATLNVEIAPEVIATIASQADGSLRDAESLLDQLLCFSEPPITLEEATKALGLVARDLFFEIDAAASAYDLAAPFTLTEKIFQSGCHLHYFLESLADHYRTIALTQMGQTPPLPAYTQSATLYTKHQVLDILEYLIGALEKAQQTPFKRIHLEVVLTHIVRSMKHIPLDSLVERLEALQKGAPPPTPKQEAAFSPPPAPKEIAYEPQIEALPPVAESVSLAPKEPVQEVPFFPEAHKEEKKSAPPPAPDIQEKIKHDQVLRFASVELNGTIKS